MSNSNIKSLVMEVIYDLLEENRFLFPRKPITEGMSIGISGHKYEDDITDILKLTQYLESNVQYPLMKQMTDEEKKQINQDTITPDGNDYDKQEGTINVYIGSFPENWKPQLLGGIQHFLNQKDVLQGKWKVEKSNLTGKDVIRIPIEALNTDNLNPAPSILVSYGTASSAFDALGIEMNEYNVNISAHELLEKIEDYEATLGHWGGLSPKGIIYHLKEMALWAIKNGYSKITGG